MTSIAELQDYTKGAVISACGRYRYLLERHWNGGGPAVGFLMLNPSTADAEADDATIRRCVLFAHSWGYRTLYVANLLAWRATTPAALPRDRTAVGPMRDWFLRRVAMQCDRLVCAWGASLPGFVDRDFIARTVTACSDSLGIWEKCWCLGKTAGGQPRHPLYMKGDTELVEYAP